MIPQFAHNLFLHPIYCPAANRWGDTKNQAMMFISSCSPNKIEVDQDTHQDPTNKDTRDVGWEIPLPGQVKYTQAQLHRAGRTMGRMADRTRFWPHATKGGMPKRDPVPAVHPNSGCHTSPP